MGAQGQAHGDVIFDDLFSKMHRKQPDSRLDNAFPLNRIIEQRQRARTSDCFNLP